MNDDLFAGVYIPEDLRDFSWSSMALGILYLYHFIPLQILAVVSEVFKIEVSWCNTCLKNDWSGIGSQQWDPGAGYHW